MINMNKQDVMNFIREKIDYSDLLDILPAVRERQKALLENQWRYYYKDRCGESFISLDDFLSEFDFRIGFRESYYTSRLPFGVEEAACIDEILHFAKDFNKSYSPKVKKMVCEACACNGCPYMKEHLGHTCKDCKMEGLTMYEGYCDE